MNNVLKFLIKLRSDAGNVLGEARRVQTELEHIEQGARRTGRAIKEAFSPSALGASLMSIPGMQFLLNPYTMIASGLGTITKLGAEAETTSRSFSQLVGNEMEATKLLGEISDYASRSPFSQLDLIENAKLMMGFGVSTENIIKYLHQLGDVAMGDASKLSALSLVMGQVTATGYMQGSDNLQFVNAGFAPLQILKEMYPEKTQEELQNAVSKRLITPEIIASALTHATEEGGRFHGMVDALSETLGGRWSSILGSLQKMALEVFNDIRPFISKALDLFSMAIPHVFQVVKTLVGILTGALRFVKEWWMELTLLGSIIGIVYLAIQAKTIALGAYASVMGVVSLATKLWTGAQWLLNIALTANPIGLVIVGISALVAVVIYCWNKFAGFRAFLITAWDTFKQLGSVIKDYVVNRIHEMLEGLGKVGKALKLLLSGNFSEAWSTFKDGVQGIYGVESRRKATEATKEVVQGIGGAWQENLSREREKDSKASAKGESAGSLIGTPSLKGSASLAELDLSGGAKSKSGKNGSGDKTASAIATGGARATNIHISIGKLIETMRVQMMDKTDSHELERVVLEALNRSLAIATSTE